MKVFDTSPKSILPIITAIIPPTNAANNICCLLNKSTNITIKGIKFINKLISFRLLFPFILFIF